MSSELLWDKECYSSLGGTRGILILNVTLTERHTAAHQTLKLQLKFTGSIFVHGVHLKKKASDVPDSCISISKINPTQSEDQWYDMSDASLWCHQEAQLMDGMKTSNNHDHLNIRLMMAKFLIWTKIPLYRWGLQPHVNHLLELEAHMKIIRFLFFHTLISALLHFLGF